MSHTVLHQIFWRSAEKELSSSATAVGPHIYNPVGTLDDIQIVFYHNHRISLFHQAVQHLQQDTDIFKVKSRCGLIKDIDRLSCISLAQFGGKLYALALSTRKRGAGLSQLYITQTYILQHLYLVQNVGLVLEKLHGLVDGHV